MKNSKEFGRKQLYPNFKILSQLSPRSTEENHENMSQDNRDLNSGSSKYESGVLTTRPRRSVKFNEIMSLITGTISRLGLIVDQRKITETCQLS
jgi:hypothetical protein